MENAYLLSIGLMWLKNSKHMHWYINDKNAFSCLTHFHMKNVIDLLFYVSYLDESNMKLILTVCECQFHIRAKIWLKKENICKKNLKNSEFHLSVVEKEPFISHQRIYVLAQNFLYPDTVFTNFM